MTIADFRTRAISAIEQRETSIVMAYSGDLQISFPPHYEMY